MKIKTKQKLGLATIIILMFSQNVVFAADADAPPSLDFEAPPSLVIDLGDDDDDNPVQPPVDDGDDDNGNGNPQQPPDNDDGDEEATSNIKITNVSVSPKKLNPIIDEARLSYKISKQAKIEVKLLDKDGQVVATLLNDETQSAGTHTVNWFGTKGNSKSGKAVDAGTYTFKITAKNLAGQTKDTEEVKLEVVFGQTQSLVQPPPPKSSDPNQTQATLSLNNSKSGKTAATGPGMLVYPLIPLAYLIQRKLRKK